MIKVVQYVLMEILSNCFNTPRLRDTFRIGLAASAVVLSSCNVTPPSSERFNVECNKNPKSAEFDENGNAIFISEISKDDSAAVMVSRKRDSYKYTIESLGGEEVEFIGPVSLDGSADIDAFAVISKTEITVAVNPDRNTAEVSAVC